MEPEDKEIGILGYLFIILKYLAINVGAYIGLNYDKLLGAVLTLLSIVYVLMKIRKELNPKNNGITKD